MQSIAVYCGSSLGASPIYKEAAASLGREIARRGLALVFGGASVGLMGAVADAVLEEGGRVVGILPGFLQSREIAHKGLSELIVVDSMHERKAKMAELADGFLSLPGGPGTMEEFFETFTWAQLGLHGKPCGLLNVNGYYDPLASMFETMLSEQFMQEKYRPMLLIDTDPGSLLDRFERYSPPSVKTYLKNEQMT